MAKKHPTLLVVDDHPDTLDLIQIMLEDESYNILTADTGDAALHIFKEERISLVLLDIMLPDIDGYAVCKHIRKISRVPIIMVTAKDREEEEAIGLEAGADDYITKPFTSMILLSHIKAALRRSFILESRASPGSFQYHNLNIDFIRQTVTVGGKIVKLTATECLILALLARRAGEIVSTEEILRETWGDKCEINLHTLHVNLSRLRQKLKDNAGGYEYIETVPRLGYIFPGYNILK